MVYPEHRDIAVLAVDSLDPERRAELDRAWANARTGNETRLCAEAADVNQSVAPECIDWAAMSAIAGDHSCSSEQMIGIVTDSQWILQVADVAAQLKVDVSHVLEKPDIPETDIGNPLSGLVPRLESRKARADLVNALRTADVRLQRADPEYATRAGSNNAHFLLARPTTDFTLEQYWKLTLEGGVSETNALGAYGRYHLSALQKATRLAREKLTTEERRSLERAMLADEAFGLHFLEDVFASGHVAGTWGDVSQRKGTHDYYNEHGLEAMTWQGSADTAVLMGDAHMRPEDATRAAVAVRVSLEQLLDIANGRKRKVDLPYAKLASTAPETFDACKSNTIDRKPEGLRAGPEALQLGMEVVVQTPIPGLEPGLGEMPRFRSEVGPFVGVASSLDVRSIDGGYTGQDDGRGFIGGAELSLRGGLGLDGVLGEAGDGLVFVAIGYKGETASSNDFSDSPFADEGGSLTSAIPARTAFSVRVRMPFYLIPGDLLFTAPLYFVSPNAYQQMAVTAANGGLIPWQVGRATPIGRFQFVLGREFGVTFFGELSDDTLLSPGAVPGQPNVIQFRSTYFDFPILEYRPYRAFDTTQTSVLMFQLFAGMDVPDSRDVIFPPGSPKGIDMDTVYSLGLRLIFDWRRYF